MALTTHQEWLEALEYYSANEEARRHAGEHGKAFAEENHNGDIILGLQDAVFQSVFESAEIRVFPDAVPAKILIDYLVRVVQAEVRSVFSNIAEAIGIRGWAIDCANSP